MNPQQEIDFSRKPGYSILTSLPAYREGSSMKAVQEARICSLVSQGYDNIKKLAKVTGLPDSTVAGRLNDAIRHGYLKYDGYVEFEKRRRKKIVPNQ